MKISGVFKTMLSDFLNINAETTLAIAIIGSIFADEVQITYHYFFIPLLLSAVYMLPCLPVYFMENMTVRQVIFQHIAELIVIETATLAAARLLVGDYLSITGYIAVGVSVLFFDVLTYFLQWYFEKSTADKINKIISEMRDTENRK